jgi:hypothetical protein
MFWWVPKVPRHTTQQKSFQLGKFSKQVSPVSHSNHRKARNTSKLHLTLSLGILCFSGDLCYKMHSRLTPWNGLMDSLRFGACLQKPVIFISLG